MKVAAENKSVAYLTGDRLRHSAVQSCQLRPPDSAGRPHFSPISTVF